MLLPPRGRRVHSPILSHFLSHQTDLVLQMLHLLPMRLFPRFQQMFSAQLSRSESLHIIDSVTGTPTGRNRSYKVRSEYLQHSMETHTNLERSLVRSRANSASLSAISTSNWLHLCFRSLFSCSRYDRFKLEQPPNAKLPCSASMDSILSWLFPRSARNFRSNAFFSASTLRNWNLSGISASVHMTYLPQLCQDRSRPTFSSSISMRPRSSQHSICNLWTVKVASLSSDSDVEYLAKRSWSSRCARWISFASSSDCRAHIWSARDLHSACKSANARSVRSRRSASNLFSFSLLLSVFCNCYKRMLKLGSQKA